MYVCMYVYNIAAHQVTFLCVTNILGGTEGLENSVRPVIWEVLVTRGEGRPWIGVGTIFCFYRLRYQFLFLQA